MSSFLDSAVDFALSLRVEDLPESVVHEARRTLVDTTGVILAGMSEPVVFELAERLAIDSSGQLVPLIGTKLRADRMLAALIHGTAGVWHDFDAGNRFSGGHPAIHSIPAAISSAAGQSVNGKRFLESVIAGYEIGSRIGRGTTMRKGMHPHGTWATVGAAVTSALLLGFDARALREAMNVSTSLTLATSWRAAFEGATIRNVYAGAGAAAGVLATDLTAAGFTGERDGIATVFGGLSGLAWDPDTALDGLGERWEIESGYAKLLASARYLHPSIDALVDALGDQEVDPAIIEMIEFRTFEFAASMTETEPENSLAAKFSLPHAAAAQVVLGDGGIDAFTASALANPTIRALAKRVKVEEDPEMSKRTPDERPASVVIHLADGSIRHGERSLPHGDDEPVTDEAVLSKFIDCSERILEPDKAMALRDRLWNITEAADVDELW